MIKTEMITETLIRTWSDAGVYIKGGNPEGLYTEAIDPVSAGRTYVETDIPIDTDPEDEATVEDYQAALEKMGVDLNEENGTE